MPSIDSTTKISKAQGYDTDGNLQFVTRPYASGDKIAATWIYHDEFGRTSVVLTPGHVLEANATSETFNTSRYWYQPKLTLEQDPMGYITTTTFDTMNRSRSTDGHLRVTEQYDALGNVVRTTDGDGVSLVTTYDPFYRPCTRYYDNEITLYDGTKAKPTWKYEYDLVDRLQASTDPEQNRTEWDYDDIGRVLQKRFVEYGTSPSVVVQKSVYHDYTGPGSRRVTTTDVNGNSTTTFFGRRGKDCSR
jgi:YD repeat-containing protein